MGAELSKMLTLHIGQTGETCHIDCIKGDDDCGRWTKGGQIISEVGCNHGSRNGAQITESSQIAILGSQCISF